MSNTATPAAIASNVLAFPAPSPEQSRDSVKIVDAEKKSAKTGKPVRIGK